MSIGRVFRDQQLKMINNQMQVVYGRSEGIGFSEAKLRRRDFPAYSFEMIVTAVQPRALPVRCGVGSSTY